MGRRGVLGGKFELGICFKHKKDYMFELLRCFHSNWDSGLHPILRTVSYGKFIPHLHSLAAKEHHNTHTHPARVNQQGRL
jgi:hypothetical protein